jgi:hypothetical protein
MENYDIESELRPNLSLGEKLIWVGRPKTGIVFRRSDVFLIPFSLLWTGFAILWETTAIAYETHFFLKLWGVPFILVGLYTTVGRFFVEAKQRANTVYGITPDRIIIKTGLFSKETQSLNIKALPDITINQKSDNTGTITLGTPRYSSRELQPPKLEFIEDVKNVYETIINLQRQKQ